MRAPQAIHTFTHQLTSCAPNAFVVLINKHLTGMCYQLRIHQPCPRMNVMVIEFAGVADSFKDEKFN